MTDSLAGFVLAAGEGRRLRPLTRIRPKALCPVGNVALVDLALEKLHEVCGGEVAVNVHHHREQLEAHLRGRAHLSVEPERALGTAGGVAHARDWIDGRAVLATNVDAWHQADLGVLVDGWDGERVRVCLVGGGELLPTSQVVASLLPWGVVQDLPLGPTGLYEVCWGPLAAEGRLDVVGYDGPFIDCGTPADYLAANLASSGGASVVHPDAVVEGGIERCVLWGPAHVHAGEHLVDAIRIGRRFTVLVR